MKVLEVEKPVKEKTDKKKDIKKKKELEHPMEDWLRMDRMPHIWCSTCGIGTAVTCYVEAIKKAGVDRDTMSVVSGIGCS